MRTLSNYFSTRIGALAAAALVATLAAPASASPAKFETKATAKQSARGEMRYCVESMVTGSRIRRDDCRTAAEWKADGFEVQAKK